MREKKNYEITTCKNTADKDRLKAREDTKMELKEAREKIQEAISDYRTKLEAITLTNAELEPIMVEGETETGYYCQLMVDPKEAAKILLEHEYPTWKILEEDYPSAMWQDLAKFYGLAYVTSIDL